MAQTRFSQRLSYLMKERKISGQKIGDAIGKSQKTISRYANGEVDPSNEIKNLIYKVIADIRGVKEDGTPEEELALSECLGELEWTEEEIGLAEELVDDEEDNEKSPIDRLFGTFDKLSLGAQEYFKENIRLFAQVTKEDMALMMLFRSLPPKKQNKLMRFLESTHMSFDMRGDAVKIGVLMQLVEISQDKPVLVYDRQRPAEEFEEMDRKLYKRIFISELARDYGWHCKGDVPSNFDFLGYGPFEWYYLLRIAMYSAMDDRELDMCSINNGESEIEAGSNLRTLLYAIENGYF